MTRQIVESVFKNHGLRLQISLEVNGWEVVKKYVSQGMGVSILSEVCLTGEELLALINFLKSGSLLYRSFPVWSGRP